MTLTNLFKAPMPWFGGKSQAAPHVWAALGDPSHYIEPFAGSCAVLLLRPHQSNRTYYSETVNDKDGLLCNLWRSIQLHPDATAEAASWPVSECDLTARHLALVRWAADRNFEKLMGDPNWCDPLMAGWWVWGRCCWIGGDWCDGKGPWTVNADGRIFKQAKGGTREPGVCNKRPHLTDGGQGVNRPQAREPGVSPGTPGRPWEEGDFHPMTMPELRRWFAFLSARLRHVRILCGHWKRSLTTGAAHTLPVRQGNGVCGVFLDPPYSQDVRDAGLYSHDSTGLSAQVRAWCLKHGDNPKNRIVLAGFAGEGHEELESHGWRVVEWFEDGYLRGGMAQLGDEDEDGSRHQQHLERLWCSPHCLQPAPDMPLFTNMESEAQ